MAELIPTAARKFGTNFRSVLLSGLIRPNNLRSLSLRKLWAHLKN